MLRKKTEKLELADLRKSLYYEFTLAKMFSTLVVKSI